MSLQDHQIAQNSFANEARLLSSLRHPNLPGIYDYFSENGSSYLVMDFISGETLDEHLQKVAPELLSFEDVLWMGIELATVLDYLHTQQPPIIFRDLKPSNIMLSNDGQLYLIDFGIARHFKPEQKANTETLGTQGYASPEHYSRTLQTTTLSDIYSFGAIMHQLLSGQDPADHPLFQFPTLQLQGNPQTELADLVMHMLKSNPHERPASAVKIRQEFQDALQVLKQSAGTTSTFTGPIQLPGNSYPVASQPQRSIQSSTQVPPPPLPKTVGECLYKYDHISRTIYTLVWSPDGRYLAAAGESPAQIYLWEALTNQPISICKAHERSIRTLAWSPNSHFLASASNDRSVQIWEAATGRHAGTYQQHTHWVHALTWSPNGHLIASGDASGLIHLWDIQNGQQKLTYQEHKGAISCLAFSPDGSLLASGDDEMELHIWNSVSGDRQCTYNQHPKGVAALSWSPDGTLLVSASAQRDRQVHIWRTIDSTRIQIYQAHERLLSALAWSPDGHHIASADRRTIHIWKPQQGDTLYTYHDHTASINTLAWSPDGTYLASAGDDHTIHVWRAI
jgi:WD40 repeat protein